MLGREETVAEQSHAPVWGNRATALQYNKTWKVLVGAAEAIIDPCTRAWVAHRGKTGMEKIVALRVFIHFRGHRTNDREIVRARFSDSGEKRANGNSTGPILTKFERA